MLQPIGKLPPAVYWRRRLIFVALPALLVLLLIVYLFSSGGGSAKPVAASTHPSTRTATTPPAVSTTALSTTPAPTRATSAAPVTPLCTPAGLKVQAMTGKASFTVGGQPDLYLVVTDITAKPCRQDLADKQIELTVTIGDVRVWGSHDCKIEPGVAVATLLPKVAVRRGIIWSGQTSAPGCVNPRVIAQAGAYELTATLAGQSSAPVGFVLTAAG